MDGVGVDLKGMYESDRSYLRQKAREDREQAEREAEREAEQKQAEREAMEARYARRLERYNALHARPDIAPVLDALLQIKRRSTSTYGSDIQGAIAAENALLAAENDAELSRAKAAARDYITNKAEDDIAYSPQTICKNKRNALLKMIAVLERNPNAVDLLTQRKAELGVLDREIARLQTKRA